MTAARNKRARKKRRRRRQRVKRHALRVWRVDAISKDEVRFVPNDGYEPTISMGEPLRHLADDWDGEGAPAPAASAIGRAATIVRWSITNLLGLDDVSPDVLGGVAVFLFINGRRAWFACMNDGSDAVVVSDERGTIFSAMVEPGVLESVATLLKGGAGNGPRP